MVRNGRGRDDQAFRRAAAQLRREAPAVCCGCGKEIDLSLPHTDPWSWTADHEPDIATLLAMDLDPSDITYLRPMHRRCNSAKGKRRPKPRPNVSRRW